MWLISHIGLLLVSFEYCYVPLCFSMVLQDDIHLFHLAHCSYSLQFKVMLLLFEKCWCTPKKHVMVMDGCTYSQTLLRLKIIKLGSIYCSRARPRNPPHFFFLITLFIFACRELLWSRFQEYLIGGHPASNLQFLSSCLHLSICYTLEVRYVLDHNI